MATKAENYISLKEAAALSGYTPDYIGQLIRKGKIEGKQIYSNVAWVTTPEAIEEYQRRSRNEAARKERVASIKEWWRENGVLVAYRAALGMGGVVALLFIGLSFYIVSAGIERSLAISALESAGEIEHAAK